MLFSEKDVKSGYADYIRAKTNLEMLDKALKQDGFSLSNMPKEAYEQRKKLISIITDYESNKQNK